MVGAGGGGEDTVFATIIVFDVAFGAGYGVSFGAGFGVSFGAGFGVSFGASFGLAMDLIFINNLRE